MSVLNKIQTNLNAPKNLHNKFGGYNYRSCESILEALKPLLKEEGATLVISDEMQEVGGRIYVKATATLTAKDNAWTATAFAREAETKKGMDEAQITGAASSYARKYALNGLFAIDDTKDADATNRHDSTDDHKEAYKFIQTALYKCKNDKEISKVMADNADSLKSMPEKGKTALEKLADQCSRNFLQEAI